MNDTFKNIIKNYLNSPNTPYAILIDGIWGSGKTWYLRNKFESDFDKKIIYTSANGIESLEDISQQILLRKLTLKSKLVNNPKAKLVWGIAKQFTKAAIEKYTGYDTDQAKELGVDLNDFASLNEKEVLIIDDIERMNQSISLEELLGYVSTNFTEENSFKVILVADEKQLLKKLADKKDNYLSIKEKTIWQTVQYTVDHKQVFDELVINFSQKAKKVIQASKPYLIKKFKEYEIDNLRWILYYFQMLDEILKNADTIKAIKNVKELVLSSLLILCIEYKEGRLIGRINESVPEYIKINAPVLFFDLADAKYESKEPLFKESEKEIAESFSSRYLNFEEKNYHYFSSLYKLVCFGYFDNVLLLQEVKKYSRSLTKKEKWHILLDEMAEVLKHEEKEFDEKWLKIISYLGESKYGLNDILTIAGIYENYSQVNIKFPVSKNNLYDLLKRQAKKVSELQYNRQDRYAHFKYDFLEKSNKYLQLRKTVEGVRDKLISVDVEKSNYTTLNKLTNIELIRDDLIVEFFIYANKKQVKLLADSFTDSVRQAKFIEKRISNILGTLRLRGDGKTSARDNLELFDKRIISKAKSKNIIKFYATRMSKLIDSKIYMFWK